MSDTSTRNGKVVVNRSMSLDGFIAGLGEDEHGSGPSAAVFFAAKLVGVPLTLGHLIGPPPDESAGLVEDVAVLLCRRRGAAIDLVLDRPSLSRSQFVRAAQGGDCGRS